MLLKDKICSLQGAFYHSSELKEVTGKAMNLETAQQTLLLLRLCPIVNVAFWLRKKYLSD